MDRMGHATTRAAMIYMHKKAGRDQKITDTLSDLVERSREAKAADTAEGMENPGGARRGHDRGIEIRNDEGPARRIC